MSFRAKCLNFNRLSSLKHYWLVTIISYVDIMHIPLTRSLDLTVLENTCMNLFTCFSSFNTIFEFQCKISSAVFLCPSETKPHAICLGYEHKSIWSSFIRLMIIGWSYVLRPFPLNYVTIIQRITSRNHQLRIRCYPKLSKFSILVNLFFIVNNLTRLILESKFDHRKYFIKHNFIYIHFCF